MTIEQLLKLDNEGWEDLSKMDDITLKEYLKDIIVLEPPSIIDPTRQLVGGDADDEEEVDNVNTGDPNNPFSKGKKSKVKKAKKTKTKPTDADIEDIMKEFGM